MTKTMLICLAGVGLLAIGGCKPKSETPAGAQPAAPETVSLPHRKPGLWRQSMLLDEGDAIQNVKLCLDAASDAKLAWWSQPGNADCSKSAVQRQPDGSWSFESVCKLGGGGQVGTQGRAVGDFERSYQITADSQVSGSPQEAINGSHSVTIDAVWEADCPKGMKPGDMDLPGGRRINVLASLTPKS